MIFAWFAALPRWAHVLLFVAAGLAPLLIWDHFDDKAAVSADRAKDAAKVEQTARKADAAAVQAVEAIQGKSDMENQAARDAAAKSDDPLKAGLDRLREKR